MAGIESNADKPCVDDRKVTIEQPSKRDLQKQARRAAILEAAERLIRDSKDVSFSMVELAQASGLSLATPYNLFGNKSAILYALLNQSADRMFSSTSVTSKGGFVARTLAAAKALAQVLSEDPAFYRPLYAFLMGVPDAGWRPAFILRSHEYWTQPFSASVDQLPVAPGEIGHLMVVQALGCVELWVHQDIADSELERELLRSSSAILLGISEPNERVELLKLMATPRSPRIEMTAEIEPQS